MLYLDRLSLADDLKIRSAFGEQLHDGSVTTVYACSLLHIPNPVELSLHELEMKILYDMLQGIDLGLEEVPSVSEQMVNMEEIAYDSFNKILNCGIRESRLSLERDSCNPIDYRITPSELKSFKVAQMREYCYAVAVTCGMPLTKYEIDTAPGIYDLYDLFDMRSKMTNHQVSWSAFLSSRIKRFRERKIVDAKTNTQFIDDEAKALIVRLNIEEGINALKWKSTRALDYIGDGKSVLALSLDVAIDYLLAVAKICGMDTDRLMLATCDSTASLLALFRQAAIQEKNTEWEMRDMLAAKPADVIEARRKVNVNKRAKINEMMISMNVILSTGFVEGVDGIYSRSFDPHDFILDSDSYKSADKDKVGLYYSQVLMYCGISATEFIYGDKATSSEVHFFFKQYIESHTKREEL